MEPQRGPNGTSEKAQRSLNDASGEAQRSLRGVPEESQRDPSGCAKPDGVVDFWRHSTWGPFCNRATFPETDPHAEVVFWSFRVDFVPRICDESSQFVYEKATKFPKDFSEFVAVLCKSVAFCRKFVAQLFSNDDERSDEIATNFLRITTKCDELRQILVILCLF